jgi:hypothetical protein
MYDMVLSQQAFGMPIVANTTRYKQRTTAWYNHPATQMWKGVEYRLAVYGSIICAEWIKRGFKDSLLNFFVQAIQETPYIKIDMPLIGNESFHQSHQSNLVRKDPAHYRKYFPTVPSNLPYIWKV